MKQLLIQILSMITMLRKKLIYRMALDHLGVDASPNDKVPDELGCAETVTTILNKAVGTPIITGTWTMYDYMNRNWHPTERPKAGDVLISPTGESKFGNKAPFVGHTAIVGERGVLLSNDSRTGKFMTNYTMESWKARYVKKGGYPMYFYTYKL